MDNFKNFKKQEPVKKADPATDILKEATEKIEKIEKEETTEKKIMKPKDEKVIYKVVVDALNVRKTPNGDILRVIKSGDEFVGGKIENGWIKLANEDAFVMAKFVAPKKG